MTRWANETYEIALQCRNMGWTYQTIGFALNMLAYDVEQLLKPKQSYKSVEVKLTPLEKAQKHFGKRLRFVTGKYFLDGKIISVKNLLDKMSLEKST